MDALAERLEVSEAAATGIALLVVIQFVLMIYALLDLYRRDTVAGDNKWLWLLIIVLANLIGPVIYLAVGRNAPSAVDDVPESEQGQVVSRDERIRAGVDSLYGERGGS